MTEGADRSQSRVARVGRRALVRLDGRPVGIFIETDSGTRFAYDPDWLQQPDAVPVSLVLPLRPEPYEWHGIHPVFENLLPEGWLLGIATTKLKIAPDDGFGLLLATCADCVGAVEILPMAEEPAP